MTGFLFLNLFYCYSITVVPIFPLLPSFTHNGILHNLKKEGTPTLCDSMDGTGEYYAKCNKPGGERQILYHMISPIR